MHGAEGAGAFAVMRSGYPADGGGLTAAGRARREQVRLSAAAMFEQDMKPVQVAC